MYEKGKYAGEFFNHRGDLRHIKRLRHWPLDKVLEEKYRVPKHEVRNIDADKQASCHVARHSQSLELVFCKQAPLVCACPFESVGCMRCVCTAVFDVTDVVRSVHYHAKRT